MIRRVSRVTRPGALLQSAGFLLAIGIVMLYAKTAGAADDAPASLSILIHEYVRTQDRERADALLGDIRAHPKADVPTVEAMLQSDQVYTAQPVGLQPGVPLAVLGRSFRYGLYVPPSYQPSRSYALVL